jgi:TolA-binding protein
MKKIILFTLLLLILSGCTAGYSEDSVQTAVAEAMATTSASQQTTDQGGQGDTQANAQIEELQQQVDSLNQTVGEQATLLTQQAAAIADLENQIATYEAEPTATSTATPTNTPLPSPTGLPSNMMYVIAIGTVNLRVASDYNKAGNPIMTIPKDRVQYKEGDRFIVYRPQVMADGGDRYYEVVGPKGAGMFVRIQDITIER